MQFISIYEWLVTHGPGVFRVLLCARNEFPRALIHGRTQHPTTAGAPPPVAAECVCAHVFICMRAMPTSNDGCYTGARTHIDIVSERIPRENCAQRC